MCKAASIQCSSRYRRLQFEACENRCMLAAMTDIVFLVDESGSSADNPVGDWLQDMLPALQAEFDDAANDIDARYGLVGFGQFQSQHANSFKVDASLPTTDPAALFGDSTELDGAIPNLVRNGDSEDGWDAIEHAIAEYQIRDDAVPVFILIQNEDGRVDVNTTLTTSAVSAALKSKNALLNSIVVAPFDTAIANPVFGVESAHEDGDGDSTTHTAYIQGAGAAYSTSVFDDDLHDINGAGGDRTEVDYVELAWNTGGAAWNVDVIGDNFVVGGPQNNTMAAFNDAFVESVTAQILWADAAGEKFVDDRVLLELNLGDSSGVVEGFEPDDGTYTADRGVRGANDVTTSDSIDTESFSIPTGVHDVFQTARTPSADFLQLRSESGESTGAEGLVATGQGVQIAADTMVGFGASAFGHRAREIDYDPETFTGGETTILQDATDGNELLDDTELGAFSFSFFGEDYDELRVHIDGYITLGSVGSSTGTNVDWTQTATTAPTIAVLWDNLAADDTQGEVLWEVLDSGGNDERLVIQWDNLSYFDDFPATDSITFQAVLYASGDIEFHYQDITAVGYSGPENDGGESTVGIANPAPDDLLLTIDTLDGNFPVQDGTYVIELFFAEIEQVSAGDRFFDVVVEDELLLHEYEMRADYAKIDPPTAPNVEFDTEQAFEDTGIVKRFEVDVTGGEINIELVNEDLFGEPADMPPLLNAVRVLESPSTIVVTTTVDEINPSNGASQLSLREAVQLANDRSEFAREPINISVPTGHYDLTRSNASEPGDATYNDLDVTGDVRIVGDGPGLTVVDATDLNGHRVFHVRDVGGDPGRLELSSLTVTGGDLSGTAKGGGIYNEGTLILDQVAVVANDADGGGGGIHNEGDLEITRSVFYKNNVPGSKLGAAVWNEGSDATMTVSGTVFADHTGNPPDVYTSGGAAQPTSGGNNLVDMGYGGPFTPTSGDLVYNSSSPTRNPPQKFVVTSLADTYTNKPTGMETPPDYAVSLRDAVDLAKDDGDEIWAPAWDFVLYREGPQDANGYLPDNSIEYGDLEISVSLKIQFAGNNEASVVQSIEAYCDSDSAFDLLGDFDGDGVSDGDVDGADFVILQRDFGTNEASPADADDDGDVDMADQAIFNATFGNTLDLEWVAG